MTREICRIDTKCSVTNHPVELWSVVVPEYMTDVFATTLQFQVSDLDQGKKVYL
jgi:hypothetical protein